MNLHTIFKRKHPSMWKDVFRSRWADSNRRPLLYESIALPTELQRRHGIFLIICAVKWLICTIYTKKFQDHALFSENILFLVIYLTKSLFHGNFRRCLRFHSTHIPVVGVMGTTESSTTPRKGYRSTDGPDDVWSVPPRNRIHVRNHGLSWYTECAKGRGAQVRTSPVGAVAECEHRTPQDSLVGRRFLARKQRSAPGLVPEEPVHRGTTCVRMDCRLRAWSTGLDRGQVQAKRRGGLHGR